MRTADKFCDLAGFDPEREEAVVYAHDGSQLTLIEIDGTRSIISGEDYLINVVERFAGGIAQILKRPGHQITISYESSLNTARILDPFVAQQGRRSRQKGLSVEALIEEGREWVSGTAEDALLAEATSLVADATWGEDSFSGEISDGTPEPAPPPERAPRQSRSMRFARRRPRRA